MPALGALGALDVVVLAAVAAILAMAFLPLFRPLLGSGLSQLPIVGDWLAPRVDGVLFSAYIGSFRFVEASIRPLVDMIVRVRWVMFMVPGWTVNAFFGAYQATLKLRDVYIPAAERRLTDFVNWSSGVLRGEYSALHRIAIDYINWSSGVLRGEYTGLFRYAVDFINWSSGVLRGEYTGLFQQAAASIVAAEERAGLYARLLAGQAEGYALGLARSLLASLDARVMDLERFAERVGADAEGYARTLRELGDAYARELVMAAAAIAAAEVAAVAVRVRAIERSPCQRFCGPLGDVGELLQELGDAGLLALMLELISESRRDPGGVARAIDGSIGQVARSTAGALQLGLPE